jgi:putative DNA primase/helicase
MTPGETLTTALGGRWHGSYGEALCPVHDDRSPSLSIRDGERAPLVKCHRGCDRIAIITALRRAGHWADSEADRGPNHTAAERRRRDEETLRYVLSIWRQARPISGTPAERYLRARSITLELPPSLRYHPGLKHTDTGLVLPAMLAAVQAPDRRIFGMHRTYLRPDGADKAAVSKPKKMLGRFMTGAIRLAAAGPALAIGEGIETALSYMQATGVPTWAAICTNGMSAVVLPPLPVAAIVYLLVDLDPAGEEAAGTAAARLAREGRRVKLVRPTVGKDFNDALREHCHA